MIYDEFLQNKKKETANTRRNDVCLKNILYFFLLSFFEQENKFFFSFKFNKISVLIGLFVCFSCFYYHDKQMYMKMIVIKSFWKYQQPEKKFNNVEWLCVLQLHH